ncbi:MAG: GntR family transcriptional regulator [Acidimicrobiaceae bacterium]|nr:GntR family transcriptional regulator [Acidimicrobiaceae bacterium]
MVSQRAEEVRGGAGLSGQAGPTFLQIAAIIRHEIEEGKLAGYLPTERELSERFGVSRTTVRRALAASQEDGLIGPSWGRGWYVASSPLSEPPNALLSFSELAKRRGLTARSKVLKVEERRATLDEAEELQVTPGSYLLVLERLRLLNDVPTVVQSSHLPLERLDGMPPAAELDFENCSLYDLLQECCGVVAYQAHYVVEARAAGERDASLLEIAPGSPLLCARQITFDPQSKPIERHWSVYPHDRYRFEATLKRPRPERPVGENGTRNKA